MIAFVSLSVVSADILGWSSRINCHSHILLIKFSQINFLLHRGEKINTTQETTGNNFETLRLVTST